METRAEMFHEPATGLPASFAAIVGLPPGKAARPTSLQPRLRRRQSTRSRRAESRVCDARTVLTRGGGVSARSCSLDAVLAGTFRLVERAVGGRDEVLRVRHLGEGGDTQADRDVDRRPLRREDGAPLEGRAGALGQARSAIEVGPREDDRELLAAPASRQIDLAHTLPQGLGELDQDAVTDGMAEPVVDR